MVPYVELKGHTLDGTVALSLDAGAATADPAARRPGRADSVAETWKCNRGRGVAPRLRPPSPHGLTTERVYPPDCLRGLPRRRPSDAQK